MHRGELGVGVSHAPRTFETEMAARYFERPVAQPRPQGAFP